MKQQTSNEAALLSLNIEHNENGTTLADLSDPTKYLPKDLDNWLVIRADVAVDFYVDPYGQFHVVSSNSVSLAGLRQYIANRNLINKPVVVFIEGGGGQINAAIVMLHLMRKHADIICVEYAHSAGCYYTTLKKAYLANVSEIATHLPSSPSNETMDLRETTLTLKYLIGYFKDQMVNHPSDFVSERVDDFISALQGLVEAPHGGWITLMDRVGYLATIEIQRSAEVQAIMNRIVVSPESKACELVFTTKFNRNEEGKA